MSKRRFPRRIMVGGAVTATIVLSCGVAWASSVVGNGSPVHSCYSMSTGALRVIDPTTGQKCTSAEGPLSLATTDTAGRVNDSEKLGGLGPAAFVRGGGRSAQNAYSVTVANDGSRRVDHPYSASPFGLYTGCSVNGAQFEVSDSNLDLEAWTQETGQPVTHGLDDKTETSLVKDGTVQFEAQAYDRKTGASYWVSAFVTQTRTLQYTTCAFAMAFSTTA